jgi:hypothetical protein
MRAERAQLAIGQEEMRRRLAKVAPDVLAAGLEPAVQRVATVLVVTAVRVLKVGPDLRREPLHPREMIRPGLSESPCKMSIPEVTLEFGRTEGCEDSHLVLGATLTGQRPHRDILNAYLGIVRLIND